jgi:hypothetical protein
MPSAKTQGSKKGSFYPSFQSAPHGAASKIKPGGVYLEGMGFAKFYLPLRSRCALRFGAQKPLKGWLHQPFSIDVGPPFCGGRLEREGAGSADAGRRGRPTIGVVGEAPPGAVIKEIGDFAPNRRCARPAVQPKTIWRISNHGQPQVVRLEIGHLPIPRHPVSG